MRFCKKCNSDTERYKDGKCKPCVRAQAAAWKSANPGKHRASIAAWQAANPEKHRASVAKHYAANRERLLAANANWAAANQEARRIHSQNRRAKKREAGGKLSRGLAERLFKLQRGKCACGCGQPLGDDYHLDHRMPLALGGTNTDDNIQLLRQTCNNQKHAKHPIDFMQSRGFLL